MNNNIIDITTPAAFEADCEEIDSQLGGLEAEQDWKIPETAEIVATHIGSIDKGCDGRDEYVLVTRLDDDINTSQAETWVLEQCFNPGRGPGSYFCHTVLAVQAYDSPNQCICTVQHRYDV